MLPRENSGNKKVAEYDGVTGSNVRGIEVKSASETMKQRNVKYPQKMGFHFG
jgi:hypothetical protein